MRSGREQESNQNPTPFQYDSVAWAQLKAHDLRQPSTLLGHVRDRSSRTLIGTLQVDLTGQGEKVDIRGEKKKEEKRKTRCRLFMQTTTALLGVERRSAAVLLFLSV